MRSKGAYTSIERIVDGTAIRRIWPVAPNVEFISSQVEIARHSRSASTNQDPYSNRTNGFITPSLNLPRDQRNISALNATISKISGPGVTIGGTVAACLTVLVLLLVPCYLKCRRRRAESTRSDDMEYGLSRQSNFASSDHKASDSNPAPADSQPSSKRVAFVGLPTSPSSKVKVTGEGLRKPPRPACPPAPPIPPGCASREMLQGDPSETAVPVNYTASPSSRVTGERIRKQPTLPRPPPLVLHRVARKAPKIGSHPVAKLRIITFTNDGNRCSLSLLPNPWDNDAISQHTTFELAIFQRPSYTASVRRARLPRTPRETRIFMPPKVRLLGVTQNDV